MIETEDYDLPDPTPAAEMAPLTDEQRALAMRSVEHLVSWLSPLPEGTYTQEQRSALLVARLALQQAAELSTLRAACEQDKARIAELEREVALHKDRAHHWRTKRFDQGASMAQDSLDEGFYRERCIAAERDRDEWKTQHENLVGVRLSDLAAAEAAAARLRGVAEAATATMQPGATSADDQRLIDALAVLNSEARPSLVSLVRDLLAVENVNIVPAISLHPAIVALREAVSRTEARDGS